MCTCKEILEKLEERISFETFIAECAFDEWIKAYNAADDEEAARLITTSQANRHEAREVTLKEVREIVKQALQKCRGCK